MREMRRKVDASFSLATGMMREVKEQVTVRMTEAVVGAENNGGDVGEIVEDGLPDQCAQHDDEETEGPAADGRSNEDVEMVGQASAREHRSVAWLGS